MLLWRVLRRSTLIDAMDVRVLQQEILATMNDWGAEILADPERYNNRFYVAFIVQNYCRMLHDLMYGTLSSKLKGVTWAKENLDPEWHGLIDRTWAGRPNPAVSVRTRADKDDFAAMLVFLREVMDLSLAYAAEQGIPRS